jgi:DHA2 family multidrug resistance protein
MIMVTISLIATAYILPQDAGRRRACSTSCATSAARSASPCWPPCWMRAKTYFDYLREAVVPSNPQVAERLALTERWAMTMRRWAS